MVAAKRSSGLIGQARHVGAHLLYRQYESRMNSLDRRILFDDSVDKMFMAISERIGLETDVYSRHIRAKAYHIIEVLKQCRPASVIELGSGRTSVIFALLAARMGFSYRAFEQDQRWADLVNGLLEEHSIAVDRQISHLQVQRNESGGRFAEAIPAKTEFLYVDAPYVVRNGRTFPTFTGKPAFSDTVEFISNGGCPKLIMVDGRTDTVDLILSHPTIAAYRFQGEFAWAMQRKRIGHALKFNRHSVFKRT